jgi:hypothetical protein
MDYLRRTYNHCRYISQVHPEAPLAAITIAEKCEFLGALCAISRTFGNGGAMHQGI